MRAGAGAEVKNLKQTPHWAQSPTGAWSQDPEITTFVETNSPWLNGLSHPGAC